MKKRLLLSFLLLIVTALCVTAQNVPQGINYQCIVRNNQTGDPITNQTVTLLFSIRNGSANGPVDYQEKHIGSTNDFGLANLVIGRGQAQVNTFSAINWGAGSKFLTVLLETTPNVFDEIGNSELLSVPYALYAQNGGGGSNDNWGAQTAFTNNGLVGNGLANNPIGLAQQGAQSGQILKWNGTAWAPADDLQSAGTNGGTVTQINTGTGIQGGPVTTTGTLSLTNTGVVPGTHGSATEIPVITVDAQGRITNIEKVIVQPGAVGINSGNGINVVTNGFNNFTVNNTGDTNPNDDVTLTTIHDGDVSGTYNNLQLNPNVVTSNELNAGAVTAPKLANMGAANGQVLKWNGTSWAPAADDSGNVALTGGAGINITGSAPNFTIVNTGDTNGADDITTATQANGDVSGPFNNLQIKPGVVTNVEIADDAVGSSKILDGSVNTLELAANAVTTVKIADGAVSTVKLANDAVTSAKIVDGTISTVDIANQAVTGDKIDDMSATNGQVLKWNGTTWAPAADGTGNFNVLPGAGMDVTQSGNTFIVINAGDTDATDDLTNATVFNGDVTGPSTNLQLKAGVVVNADMAANSIGTANLINGAVTGAKLNNMGALNGQILQYNGTTWVPVTPAPPAGDNWGAQTVQTNATLSGNGTAANQLGIAQQGAANGQVLRWNGAAWVPGTITVGAALTGNGTAATPINLAQQGAANGQFLSWNGAGWVPANAPGDNWGGQSAQVGAALIGNGTVANPLNLAQQGAVNGQILQWNGAAWLPANLPPVVGDNWGAQSAQVGAALIGNGTVANPLNLAPQGAVNGQFMQFNGLAWVPANLPPAVGDNWGAQSAVVGTTLAGNGTVATPLNLAPQGANVGEVLKWNGATWLPSADNSGGTGDNYIGGTGIQITGASPNFTINNIGDADNVPTNELQNLSIVGNVLSISNGNAVNIPVGPTYNAGAGISLAANTITNTGDLSVTNELQNLSIAANVLSISNGNSVNIPVGPTYTAGAGISLAGNVIANTGDLSDINELQELKLTGSILEISNGNSVDLDPLLGAGSDDWDKTGNEIFNVNTGNVLIGTNVNTAGKLQVISGGAQPAVFAQSSAGPGGSFTSTTGPSLITDLGNVGIGTPAPAARLHIVGNGESLRLQGPTPSITFVPAAGAPGYARMFNASLSIGTNDASNISLVPNGFNSVVANGLTGNVGIGELNLTNASLRVLQKQGGLVIHNQNNGNFWEFSADPANGSLVLLNSSLAGPAGVFLPNGTYVQLSDRRLKTDLSKISNSVLDKMMKLQPMSYRYTAESPDSKHSIGFIAQDMQVLFPELVGQVVNPKTGVEYLNVNYSGLGVLTVKAIQEQQKEIELLKKENDALRSRTESLEARLLRLEQLIGEKK